MLEQATLLREQEDLLAALVEASRNVPREQRQKFMVVAFIGSLQHTVRHPGLPRDGLQAYIGDLEALASEGLITIVGGTNGRMSRAVDVTPRGYGYYNDMKLRSGQPLKEIESTVMEYLNAEPFRERYPNAHAKWTQASDRLWSSDSEQELTVIGHLCREAMQEFAAALVERFNPPDVDPNPQHVVARIRAVLSHVGDRLGRTEHPFLDALLVYWGTVSDLVQGQEHGGQREAEPLIWEDGRRVVFQTANVMFEVDRALLPLS